MAKQPQARQYLIDSEKVKDIKTYLMTRPYADVVTMMNRLTTLMPYDPTAGEKEKEKKEWMNYLAKQKILIGSKI